MLVLISIIEFELTRKYRIKIFQLKFLGNTFSSSRVVMGVPTIWHLAGQTILMGACRNAWEIISATEVIIRCFICYLYIYIYILLSVQTINPFHTKQ
jgi:hypothetical protein